MLNSNKMTRYDWQSRTLLLLGEEKIKLLQKTRILIVGLGGVGAYAAEMLCRAGITKLTLVDGDVIDASNRNRQLLALHSTLGEYKTELMKKRCEDINPLSEIEIVSQYIKDEQIVKLLDDKNYHYVIDAIDT
jgi:tRNA A37 threonylcarbamoyladenosine dehydratase